MRATSRSRTISPLSPLLRMMLPELFFGLQAALGVDRQQIVAARRHRLRAELAGGDLHVLLLHGAHHVGGGQATRGNLVRIEPDAHRILTGAENLHLADARQTGQLILDLQGGVVAQVQRIVLAGRRYQMHHQRQRRRLLLGGDALAAHVFRQARFGLRHAVLHLHLRLIGIGARAEGDGGHQHAVGTGDRFHVHHVFDAVDRFFQRRCHRFSDLFRVGARVFGAHLHAGRHHVRVLADRQQRDGDRSGDKNQDRQHRGKDRPVDKNGKSPWVRSLCWELS